MDIFRETIWNSHRVRCQKDAQLPKGVPNHLYSFPENYGAEQCGMAKKCDKIIIFYSIFASLT